MGRGEEPGGLNRPEFAIREVHLVQVGDAEDTGTLYVDVLADGRDAVRVYRRFPVTLYERWMERDFAPDIYFAEIAPAYACEEEG